MATKVVKNLKRSHSVEDVCVVEAKVPKGDDGTTEGDRSTALSRGIFLREALKKIELIQSVISHGAPEDNDVTSEDDSFNESGSESDGEEIDGDEINDLGMDAESLGFAMCARETISFLINEGFSANSGLIQALKDRLVGRMRGLPF
uniref:Uncharacterized protein n=1 Tax=Lutzomyia longipalpis TaxID=7200 RepID=A0A1B0CA11_LUTLO